MARLVTFLLLAAAMVCAQTPAVHTQAAQSGGTPAAAAPDAAQIVKLFGPAFRPDPAFPVLVADFDGDGAEDAVAVATGEDPALDQFAFHYRVSDPMSAAFGFKDPKLMQKFSTEEKPRYLLIVLNWRAPKAKFVLMNVPFDSLSVTRVPLKKKAVFAVRATDVTGMKSAVYWDGKQWKWEEE
jgi:hypothetical protein